MNLQQIEQHFFASSQISIQDIPKLASDGFKTIICNRPDQEDLDQPLFNVIQETALHYGIQSHYVPITPPTIEQSSIDAMREVLKTAPRPIVAYCRHGTRSIRLYNLALL
ncbi:TIGR01244 family sulfur transferase [Bartonella ancashensis]|uniref:Sulfide-quinone reductase n=1 Tax=Bartonella ancashensis TaxID=1318743 RepID=A0A0M4M2B4_9HYPH|nr:TIGR01244 family sulfur transferase [Bartonella ancashensis]ALE02987.1 Sulfide-quinone reductase [Bartonella ancashensis]